MDKANILSVCAALPPAHRSLYKLVVQAGKDRWESTPLAAARLLLQKYK